MKNIDLLRKSPAVTTTSNEAQDIQQAVESVLASFGNKASVVSVESGLNLVSVVLEIKKGATVANITKYEDDFTVALAGRKVRFQTAVQGIQGIVLEVPTLNRGLVTLGDVIEELPVNENTLHIAIGKKSDGSNYYLDLANAPHILVAGRTGSGKSVCINSAITSLLESKSADELKLLLIDPKMVELTPYESVDHMLAPVATNSTDAMKHLQLLCDELNYRKEQLRNSCSRNIASHRAKGNKMPYIVCVIDELANLMLSEDCKEIEKCISMLCAEARAFGIHLIVATQRPSVDVITGVIKANIPTRIAFAVTTEQDSRVIIDSKGAESLLGKGDMLVFAQDMLNRGQGCFVSEEELDQIVSAHSNGKRYEMNVSAPIIDATPILEQEVKQENSVAQPTIIQDFLGSAFKSIVQETAQHIQKVGVAQFTRNLLK
jgi:S-DNA-T family DNA segregation ATPase FtsK/SpoIIIE